MVQSKQLWQFRMILNSSVKIVEGIPKKIFKIKAFECFIGDVEDPVLYAAEPLIKWEKSDAGQYIMNHSIEEPIWHQHINHAKFGTQIIVTASLYEEDLTFYTLKYI